ncbi:ABC transporter substrate-binding protein [Planktothrix sp. FACHB-1355]|uniref:ABC transporter substrate-binding protein n=1 Tax=Aerosakkonema funiforme FACHB-1375 TaxID=2949571 RepID=A0A926ZK41_9CYAN|nr:MULTISPECIES: ABC transporter substrate-binding protein [Oscillatoriales]MBD2185017.1 ABC transporter substrate-binding protein [Aerosakkonema funiforme FACHB-1375]MBD3561004.1 ABC transporter substrate-binding protein [Planktothrix sp. FACHB-1355]
MISAISSNFRRCLSALLVLILALTCQFALTGCRVAQFKTKSAQVSQLVLTALTDPKTFNPALNQEFPNIFLFAFDRLTTENGVTGEVEPALAEFWEISQDKKRVVFTLREGLQWSDGQPLTADDVVFTFEDVIFNKQIPTDFKDSFKIGASGAFPKVRKISNRQVEFILPEPFAPLLRAVAGPEGVSILPKHILQASVQTKGSDGNPRFISTWGTDTDPTKIVVNGPYQLESLSPGQRLVFRRNPYYWRKDEQGNQMPYIERIIWQFIENTDTQLLAFRSGDLDVMGDVRPLRPEYYSLLKKQEKQGKFKVYNGGPWSGTTYITFNLSKARDKNNRPFVDPIKSRWFNNLAFRQAVAYAIDRQKMRDNIFRGIGELQNSPISVQSPYYLKDGLKVYNHNPEKAKQLLISAGFKYNDRGELLDADGHRVRFTFLTNSGNKIREAIGAQIKDDLSKIGIQIDFTPINFNTLIDKINTSRDWEAHMIGFTGGIDPHGLTNLWTSRGGSHTFNLAPQPGQPPIKGWQPLDWELEIDRLFAAGAREFDETKRQAIYAEFQRIVQEQLPVIHLVNETALMAVRDRVQGVKYTGLPSWGLWNIQELKIVNK